MRWWVLGIGVAWLLGAGCRCGAPETEARRAAPHFEEWPGLIEAVRRDDRESARAAARQLSGGPLADGAQGVSGQADADVAAALGFVPFADDVEALEETVIRAAHACGVCHAASDASPPPPVQGAALERLVDTLVWGREDDPTATGACAECHPIR